MNVTLFLEKNLDHLKRLQQHESLMLTFSYYSGFIISSFNFFIFLIAITLYFQVIVDRERFFSLILNVVLMFFLSSEINKCNLMSPYSCVDYVMYYQI